MERNSSLQNQNEKKRAAYLSLAIGFLMFFLKIFAFIITGSSAILSDAIESIVHIFATSIAFISLIISLRPPDETHPYGHGKIEYFSAGFEGGLIIIAAASIIFFAVEDLIFGVELQKLDIGAYLIFAASMINLGLGLFLINIGRKTNSLILEADGKHILTDSVTSIAVLVSIIIVMITGIKIIDPIIAILVGLNITFTGYKLVRQSFKGLMQEKDEALIQKIIPALQKIRQDDFIEIHKLRAWSAGNFHYVDFHLIIPSYYTIEESHSIQRLITLSLRNEIGNDLQTMIHFDPCKPSYCPYCSKKDCNIRQSEFITHIEWSKENCLKEFVIEQ
ncbi:MAG: cation diffusion facilitator family transporter [Ignavibacteria bacterium]|nr:cation diffusion facilitator family transporter [Ignavibacteria bacterium]